MHSLSFSLLIYQSLYHSLNELNLSTSHKGTTIFLLLNFGGSMHCQLCNGTCATMAVDGLMFVCVHVCASRASPAHFKQTKTPICHLMYSCWPGRFSFVCACMSRVWNWGVEKLDGGGEGGEKVRQDTLFWLNLRRGRLGLRGIVSKRG